jgi:hypothetical protein
MTTLDDAGYQQIIGCSALAKRYATPIDRESAHEILKRKIEDSSEPATAAETRTRRAAGRGSECDVRKRKPKMTHRARLSTQLLGASLAADATTGEERTTCER